MPSFAELRAKAEAAAATAKQTATTRLEQYRGEEPKEKEKEVPKVIGKRPVVKPQLPTNSTRPAPQAVGHSSRDDEEDEDEELGDGIMTIIHNKELFFRYLDEVRFSPLHFT